MAAEKLLVYILRRDLRLADNPIFHYLSTANHGFRYLLPIYVFPPNQIELSGFLKDGETSPYPPARSQLGNFWRCGPHRAKFIAQSVWDLKTSLDSCNSGLEIRLGDFTDVVSDIINHFNATGTPVSDIWMTEEMSYEEIQEQNNVSTACEAFEVNFRLWQDEKYFIDDRDTELRSANDLPDVFTTYRKSQEPLRDRPRQVLTVDPSKLPRLPARSTIPSQNLPFVSPNSLEDLETRLLKPLTDEFSDFPSFPANANSAHPFHGGEQQGRNRLEYLVKSGVMGSYAETRNGLLGPDFSTKLSAYLALGCITARQVHSELVKLEDGSDDLYQGKEGFAQGESEGSKAVRLELLWRDYMRLCTKKFGTKLFKLSGFRHDESYDKKWKTPDKRKAAGNQRPSADEVSKIMDRIFRGTTGMGLIDASQRELFHTGYTSNRARQNVASFLSKHLQIDWRYGAEWYESLLVDYDVSSNWANWQYVAGVGNDPRGDARIFNPVKQAFDYDKDGAYVRTWVPEVKDLEHVENVFQPWTASREELKKYGLDNSVIATDPLKKIEFTLERKPRGNRRPFPRGRGGGRGGRGGGSGRGNMVQMGAATNPPPLMPVPLSPQMFAPMPFDAPPYPWHGVIGMPPVGWNTSPPPGPGPLPPHGNNDGNNINLVPGGNNWPRGRGGGRGGPDFGGRGNGRGGPRGGYPPH